MKKILLINQGKTNNIGDMAITYVISKILNKKECIVTTADYWNRDLLCFRGIKFHAPQVIRVIMRIPFLIDLLNQKRISNEIEDKNTDLAIIGGGELLSSHRGFISSFSCWVNELKKRNIPVALIGVSGDINMNTRSRKMYKNALKKCDYISVRDIYTKEYIEKEFGLVVDYHPDVVFGLSALESRTYSKKNQIVCFPMKYKAIYSRYMEAETEIMYLETILTKVLINIQPGDRIILSNTTDVDVEYLQVVKKYFEKKLNCPVLTQECKSISQIVDLINDSKVVISARMHAMIIGLQYGCRIVPIEIKEKLQVFKNMYVDKEYNNDKETKAAIVSIEKAIAIIGDK